MAKTERSEYHLETGDILVGRTAEGESIYVTISLREREGDYQTIEHEKVSQITTLAIGGLVIDKDGNETEGGQIADRLKDITEFDNGWNANQRDDLRRIWNRWHLNDTIAGCAHQEPVYVEGSNGNVVDLRNTPKCPRTGYRYGTAWLVEDMDDEDAESLIRIVEGKEVR